MADIVLKAAVGGVAEGLAFSKQRTCDLYYDRAAQEGCRERHMHKKCAMPSAPVEQLPQEVQEMYKSASKYPLLCGYRVLRGYRTACDPQQAQPKWYRPGLCRENSSRQLVQLRDQTPLQNQQKLEQLRAQKRVQNQQLKQLRAQMRLQNQQRHPLQQNTRRQIGVRGGQRRRTVRSSPFLGTKRGTKRARLGSHTFRKQKGGQLRRRTNLDRVPDQNGVLNAFAIPSFETIR